MSHQEGPASTTKTPEDLQIDAPSPPQRRLAWWFAVYSSTIFVCLVWELIAHWISQPLSNIFFIFPAWLLNLVVAPLGLLPALGFIAEWIAQHYYGTGQKVGDEVDMLSPLSYIVFVIHFAQTKKAKTYRAFMLLMLSLVLLTSASMVGCSKVMATVDLSHGTAPH
jgi:hypothetical protein